MAEKPKNSDPSCFGCKTAPPSGWYTKVILGFVRDTPTQAPEPGLSRRVVLVCSNA